MRDINQVVQEYETTYSSCFMQSVLIVIHSTFSDTQKLGAAGQQSLDITTLSLQFLQEVYEGSHKLDIFHGMVTVRIDKHV